MRTAAKLAVSILLACSLGGGAAASSVARGRVLDPSGEPVVGAMVTLRRSALNKLLEGITTLGEVYRVSAADD